MDLEKLTNKLANKFERKEIFIYLLIEYSISKGYKLESIELLITTFLEEQKNIENIMKTV